MADLDVVARKIASATAHLADIESALDCSREEFLGDVKNRDLTAFYLLLTIQDCIDLASHWVAEAGWAPPDDAGSAFDTLADHRIIDRELAGTLRAAVGLRNRIAHGYARIDHGRLYEEVREGSGSLKRFLIALAGTAGL